MFKSIFASIVIAITSTSAFANTVTYDCTLKTREGGNFMSDRVVFSVDTDRKQAMVYDAFVHTYEGSPKSAKFKVQNNGKYQLKWFVDVSAINIQSIRVNYIGKFDPKSKKLVVTGRLQNINSMDRPGGSGPCTLLKNETLF